MITAYVNGNEMGWLLTLLLLFFFVGGGAALAMLVIPEKYALSYGRGNIFAISSLFALVGIVGLAVCDLQTSSLDELDIGRHWEDDCSLIEIIMPEGTFTAGVNKLDCAGVVIHVPTETYNRHTSQWHMYSEKNK